MKAVALVLAYLAFAGAAKYSAMGCDRIKTQGQTWRDYCSSRCRDCFVASESPECGDCREGCDKRIPGSNECYAQQCSDFKKNSGSTWDNVCVSLNMKCKKRTNKVPECGDCLEGYRRDGSRCIAAKCSDTRGTSPYVVFNNHCKTMDLVCDDSSGTAKCVCAQGMVKDGIGGCKDLNDDRRSTVKTNATTKGHCVEARDGQSCSLSCGEGTQLKGASQIRCSNGLWSGTDIKPSCIRTQSGCSVELSPGLTAQQLCENLNGVCKTTSFPGPPGTKGLFTCICNDGLSYDAKRRSCQSFIFLCL